MAKAVILLALLASICNLSCGYGYYSSNERFDKINRKLEKLEARVEILTREILEDSDPRSCPQLEDIPSPVPADFPALLPLEARREPLAGGQLRLTLKYWSVPNVRNEETWVNLENYETIPETVSNALPSFPPGVSETQVVISQGNTTAVMVSVLAGRSDIKVSFNTSENTRDIQTCIPLPIFKIKPLGDIVYEPGQDVTVRFVVPPEHVPADGGPDSYYTNFRADPYLVDLPTGGLRSRFEDDDFAADFTSVDFLTHQKVSVRLATSTNYVSGFVHFNLEQPPREYGELVTKVERQESIVVRPRNQTGPFPPGYVNIVNQPYTHVSPDGEQQISCDRGSSFGVDCYAGCMAVGTGLIDLAVYQVDANTGVRQRLRNLEHEMSVDSTMKSTWFVVNDTGSQVHTFLCVATNTAGAAATRTIEVTFYDDLRVDVSQTGYRMINNSTVELTCAVNGSPSMNITFSNSYDNVEFGPDQVTSSPTQTVATKTMAMDSLFGGDANFLCRASNYVPAGPMQLEEYTYIVSGDGSIEPPSMNMSVPIVDYINNFYVNGSSP